MVEGLITLASWGIIVGLLTAIFAAMTGLIRLVYKATHVWDQHQDAVETNTEAVKFLSDELWELREPVRKIPEILRRIEHLEKQ